MRVHVCVRTLGLILLMTALAMLPVGTRTVQACDTPDEQPSHHAEPAANICQSTDKSTDEGTSTEDGDEPIWIRPAPDLWNGNPSTMRGTGGGPAAPVAIIQAQMGPEISLSIPPLAAVPQVDKVPTRSAWWQCVEPHAPPALS